MEYLGSLSQTLYKRRYLIAYTAIFILAIAVFFYRLGTLTPGPHGVEISYLDTVSTLHSDTIFENTVFLPHKALSKVIEILAGVSPFTIRLTSSLFAVSMLPMLYGVLRIWHTKRIATVGTLLMLSSSWFIGVSRLGTPDIMYAWGIMAAITAQTLIFHHRKHTKYRHLIMVVAAVLLGLSLYSPYAMYMYLLTVAIAHKYILRLVDELGTTELATIISVTAVVTIPLLGGLYSQPSDLLILAGIPENFPSLIDVLQHMQDLFAHIFWRSDSTLVTSVGSLSLLGIFGASMAALGMYHYEQHLNNLRTHLIVGLFFGLFLIMAFDYSPEKTATILPLAYILISMGVVTLLAQWYKIFPLNPLARSTGFIIVALFVVITVGYHNQRYYFAWARSPEVKTSFANDVTEIEDVLVTYIDDSAHTLHIGLKLGDDEKTRIRTWLDVAIGEAAITSVIHDETDFTALDLIVAGPNISEKQIGFSASAFELDSSIDTKSLIKPQTYNFYTPKTD